MPLPEDSGRSLGGLVRSSPGARCSVAAAHEDQTVLRLDGGLLPHHEMLTTEQLKAENLVTRDSSVSTGVDDGRTAARLRACSRYALLAIATAIFVLPWMRLFSENGDEAISLEGARRVLEGQLPTRDFFELVGPGEFYWQALFFKIFGIHIAVSRGLLCATAVGMCVLIYHLSRRIKADGVLCAGLFAAAGIARFPITSYHWDADLFALSAFAFFIEWQRKSKLGMLALSAAFAGLTMLIMQQKGILLICALLLSTYLVQKKSISKCQILWFIGVACAPFIGLLCFYAGRGALVDLIETDFLWPARHYAALNGCPYGMWLLSSHVHGIALGLKNVMAPWAAFVLTGIVSSPLWIVVLLPGLLICFALLQGKRAFSAELVPFWLCGAALWISELQRPDYSHLVWGCPIWLILLSLLVKTRPSWRHVLVPTLSICCALLGMIEFSVALGAPVKLPERNGTLYGYRSDEVFEYLAQHTWAGENVFVYPYDAMYNFLSGTRNPTRYTYLLHGMHTPNQFREVVRDLDRKRVRLVLWDTSFTPEVWKGLFPSYQTPKSADLIVEAYLLREYHEVARTRSGFRIMERNGSESKN